MHITLNGQETELSAEHNVASLLENHGFSGKVVAVAINGAFVPKSAHESTMINEGDKIEIVAPMQGG